jgi:integrase
VANITEKNGKFHVRVFRKGGGALCKSFTVRKDATSWGRATEVQLQNGTWKPAAVADGMTLRAALVKYGKEITPGKKGSAQESSVLSIIGNAKVAAKAMTEIRGADCAALRDQWRGEGLAAASILRRLAVLSHVFEIAAKEWSVDVVNPVKRISKPKVSNARDRILRRGELEAVLAASESVELPTVARLALETCMRLSEVVGLHWSDVSLTSRTAALRDSKNGSARLVPLSPEALRILNTLPRRIGGRVFSLASQPASKAWARAVKRARAVYLAYCAAMSEEADGSHLVDLHFHDIRHSAITRLFENGDFNTMEVAAISGHKTIQMLARYTNLQTSRLADKLATATASA